MKTFFTLLLIVWTHISFAQSYADYDRFLAQDWELPLGSSSECTAHEPNVWIKKADRMISVQPLLERFDLNRDEIMIVRNLLVSQAYNRLFNYSVRIQNNSQPKIPFIWIAAGSLASVTVGHTLQNNLSYKYSEDSRQHYIFSRLESLHDPLPPIPSIFLNTISLIKKKTAENNWRVYSDIFWQHLAYLSCGYQEAVILNRIMISRKLAEGKDEEADHYQRFISVWSDINKGMKTTGKESEDFFMNANIKLIWIEQYNILQKHMYSGFDAQMSSLMMIFNGLATADLSGPGGRPIKGFTQFCREHGYYPNLAYFPTRYEWMKYVVSEQAGYIRELASAEKIERVFERPLFESYQTLRDYDELQSGGVTQF